MRSKLRGIVRISTALFVAAALAAAFSVVIVRPGELVVVRRFGRLLPEPWAAGPHFAWPGGIDRIVRVRLDQVRRIDVGTDDPAQEND